jgi:hypothetical protein
MTDAAERVVETNRTLLIVDQEGLKRGTLGCALDFRHRSILMRKHVCQSHRSVCKLAAMVTVNATASLTLLEAAATADL